MTSVKVAP